MLIEEGKVDGKVDGCYQSDSDETIQALLQGNTLNVDVTN